jgi:DNA primase
MQEIHGKTDSREISTEIKDSARTANVREYGESRLSSGDISGKELIVVEGRADVLNLMRNGVNNVIAMNGTKLPDEIKELGKEKDIILFVDGDRGGKLIVQNVADNANVKYVASAPDGKEVEELTGKEILMSLRKRIPVKEFLSGFQEKTDRFERTERSGKFERNPVREYGKQEISHSSARDEREKLFELISDDKQKLREISAENEGSGKSILLDRSLKEIKRVSTKTLASTLKRLNQKPTIIVIDGVATNPIISSAEEENCKIIVAKNFATTNTKIKLLSL